MCYLNAIRLAAGPLWTMVKIGDTPSDVAEGLNAGMWTIGITRTGNEVGMTAGQWESATPEARAKALEKAGGRVQAAGAHYLAENVPDCLPILDAIEERVAAGERP